MNEKRYFDFDAAMAERRNKEKPFIIKAYGEEYEIPHDVPFDVILTIQRMYKDGQQEMTEEQTVDLCKLIFGEETFNKLLKKGIGLRGIMVLMEGVMKMYMSNAAEFSDRVAEKKKEEIDNP